MCKYVIAFPGKGNQKDKLLLKVDLLYNAIAYAFIS
jgi:hypothetical protein